MTLLFRRPRLCVPSAVFLLIMYSGAPGMSAIGQESAKADDETHRVEPANAAERTYRVIVFGAHPDDCELSTGGTAARWAKRGLRGQVRQPHQRRHRPPRDRRRVPRARAGSPRSQKADQILGVATQVLDNHDGELMPTLENRRAVTRLIRDWKADVVIAPRPNDYHPDHRYTGVLVQDSAYMVTVPSFCPDVPALANNPVFLYTHDSFQKPNPFAPDVVVPIDGVLNLKVDALDAIESQFYEWLPWIGHYLTTSPRTRKPAKPGSSGPSSSATAPIADRHRDQARRTLGQIRETRQIRRGLRGLRIRPTPLERGTAPHLPVLRRGAEASARSLDIDESSVSAAGRRGSGASQP